MDVHRRFALQNVYGRFASRPWGETSMGALSMRRNVYCGTKRPWGELSAGRKVYRPLNCGGIFNDNLIANFTAASPVVACVENRSVLVQL